MERIQQSTGVLVAQEPLLPAGRVSTAETADHRRWAVKRPDWCGFPVGLFAIRHGTEMFYYAIAKHNKLPMPDSQILTVKGINCWATEFKQSRLVLGDVDKPLPEEMRAKLETTFQNNAQQREAYLRALFLDVMLRNCDRKVGNILKEDAVGDTLALSYFDHEQSFGWRANIQAFGRNRIKTPAEEWAEVDATLTLERTYRWAATYSSFSERKQIFESLDLRVSMLDELKSQIPSVGAGAPNEKWIYPDQFEDMKSGLAAWWEFLLRMPYAALDSRLF